MTQGAVESLERAFATRCCSGDGGEAEWPHVGVFGDGLPEALVTAAGGIPVDVKAPPADDHLAEAPGAMTGVIEPFVDPFAARFLHRLAAGWYRNHAAIVFARDDVAALTAYQYATELRRQAVIPPDGPRLMLWNLVHDPSQAAHRFNMIQAERLLADLSSVLDGAANEACIANAIAAEGVRQAALARMEDAGVTGPSAFVWRNAGRWLPAERHAALVDAALADTPPPVPGPRIGLVGTAVAEPRLHAMLETVGPLVADLQPYGSTWPACHAGGPDLDGLIRRAASYPLHLRAAPPTRLRDALLAALAECDLVVSQVDRSDDGFGWEVPGLRQALARRDVPLVDLGFRPFRPDDAWLCTARERVRDAVGVPA